MKNIATRRPAETTTAVAAAIAFLLSTAFDWDADVTAAVTVVIGAIPAFVTAIVETVRDR